MKPAASALARTLLLGGAFAVGTFVAETAQAQTYQANKYTDPATNEVLEYNLVAPATIVPGTKYPLLVYLHAASDVNPPNRTLSSDGKGWVPQMMSADKAKTPSYWMIPISQTNSSGWGDPISPVTGPQKFEGRLTAVVLRELLTKLPIDPARLYVTGASMGARGTFDLLRRNPDLFAAGAPMASPALPEDAAIYATQNIWSVNGENDPVVQPNRDTIAAIRKLGGNPIYTELKGHGHDSWRSIYPMPEFIAWMFAQRKGVPWDKVSVAPTPGQLSAAGVTTTAGQDVVVTPPGGSFGGSSGVAGGASAGGGASTGGSSTEETAGSASISGATGLAGGGASSAAGSSGLAQAGSSALPGAGGGSSGSGATPDPAADDAESTEGGCSVSRPGTSLGATGLLALLAALASARSRRRCRVERADKDTRRAP